MTLLHPCDYSGQYKDGMHLYKYCKGKTFNSYLLEDGPIVLGYTCKWFEVRCRIFKIGCYKANVKKWTKGGNHWKFRSVLCVNGNEVLTILVKFSGKYAFTKWKDSKWFDTETVLISNPMWFNLFKMRNDLHGQITTCSYKIQSRITQHIQLWGMMITVLLVPDLQLTSLAVGL